MQVCLKTTLIQTHQKNEDHYVKWFKWFFSSDEATVIHSFRMYWMSCNDKALWTLHQGSQRLLDPDYREDVNLNTLPFLKYYWQHPKCSGLWNLSGAGILSGDLLYLFFWKEPEVLGNQDTEVEPISTKFVRGKGLSSPPEFTVGRIWLCNQWPLMAFLHVWRRRYRYLHRRNFPGAVYEQPIRQSQCQSCSLVKTRCCKSEISRSTSVLGRWPHPPGCVLILCLSSAPFAQIYHFLLWTSAIWSCTLEAWVPKSSPTWALLFT